MKRNNRKNSGNTNYLKITEGSNKLFELKNDNIGKLLSNSFCILKKKFDFDSDDRYINERGEIVRIKKRRKSKIRI